MQALKVDPQVGCAPLRPRPSPRATTIPIEAVEQHRDVFCRHLDDCLDEAVKRNWPAFSCAGCPLKGQAQIKPELRTGGDSVLTQLADDAIGYDAGGKRRASMATVYRQLSDSPRTVAEIAGGQLLWGTVREALRRLRERGIARTARMSQSSGAGGSTGWMRTGMRICERCEKRQPASGFAPKADNPDGLHDRCNACRERAHARTLARRRERWRERQEGA